MNITITGQDTLAEAVTACCQEHYTISRTARVDSDLLWLCYDTPIGPGDIPDVEWVLKRCADDIAKVTPSTTVLLSAQVPVRTTARLERLFPHHQIGYCPENIRVASAVDDFRQQSRIVVGMRSRLRQNQLAEVLYHFTQQIIWTTPETAEMIKHALNCWLGMNIAFINEIARLGKGVECDMTAVTQALRSERRISPKAPLMAGAPFGGGHLARDIWILGQLAREQGVPVPIIDNITRSNEGTAK